MTCSERRFGKARRGGVSRGGLALVVACLAATSGAIAQVDGAASVGAVTSAVSTSAHSPLGEWKSIDDQTGKAKSIVRIAERDGVYSGRIERLFDAPAGVVCDQCTDARRDQPIAGMTIIERMRASVDTPGLYEGGSILDPESGKVYRSRMRVIEGGRKLEVRGYVGAPMFGRTQTWVRP